MPQRRRVSRATPEAHRIAWEALETAYWRTVARIEHDMAAAGLPPLPWFDVLEALAAAPGGRLRLSDLAERVLLSRSGLTRLVDQIERQGLLRRETCPDDGRGLLGRLTARGRAMLERMRPVHRRAVAAHFASRLATTEAQQLNAWLGRVSSAPSAAPSTSTVAAAAALSAPPPGSRPSPGATRTTASAAAAPSSQPSLSWTTFDPVVD